jgi:hypothetical protein
MSIKNDFVQDDETMIHGVESPCENIFCILGIEKATRT